MPAVAAHLWQPGVSGNPLGRAVEKANPVVHEKRFQTALLKDLAKFQGKSKIRRLDAVVKKLVDCAIEGDLTATKLIIDRVDGILPIPYQGNPNGAGLGSAGLGSDGSPLVLVVKWGSPAAAPVDDIPMLELKAVGSTVASTADPKPKPSDTKDLA